MKRLILGALALAALLPMAADAQIADQVALTMAYAWDMDGEAADDNQIVEAAGGVIVDNGTSVGGVNYTITAQPDSCRLIDMTISDTDMTAGTITVTGVGCLGEAKVCTWSAWTGGDDDGVKTLVCSDGLGAYMASVTSVTTGVMTGESDEYFLLGYTSNSVNARAMYGKLRAVGPNGENGVDPFSAYPVALKITTSGALSTTVTSVSSNAAFTNVSVGDLLLISLQGRIYERKVTERASADSITVNSAINIPATGVNFEYKKFWASTDPADELYFPVQGYHTINFAYNVAANANTGGVILNFSCTNKGAGFPTATWYTPVYSTGTLPLTVASGATSYATYTLDLENSMFTHCQVQWRFGTGDDADAAAEDISYQIVLRK